MFIPDFEALGYWRGPAARSSGRGSYWYQRNSEFVDIRQYALVVPRRREDAYNVFVGVEHQPSRLRAEASRELVAKFLHPAALYKSVRILENPCWVVFDLGRALNWQLFAIPAPLNLERYASQFKELVGLLKSTIWSIDGPSALREALLKDEPPFNWAGTSCLLRAAQIVSISRILGSSTESIRSSLFEHQREIATQIHGGAHVEQVINEFVTGI